MNTYSREDINNLIEKYSANDLTFPGEFEHRYDPDSSRILYALLREFKPQKCLEFGTSFGGSALVTLKALIHNEIPYKYIGFEIEDSLRRETIRNVTHWLTNELPNQIHFEVWGDITKNLHIIPDNLDFVFIDPNWDEEIAIWTYENIIPKVKKGGLVHIHDWSVSKELEYQGGGFPGIKYFIEKFKEQKMPLKKLFSVWDHEDYKQKSIASSFWEKI